MITQEAINAINLALGALGTLTGIGGLLLNYKASSRDRVIIKISHQSNMRVFDPSLLYAGYKKDKDYILITVRNFGKVPAKLDKVTLRKWAGKPEWGILKGSLQGQQRLLDEKNPSTTYLADQDTTNLDEYWYIAVFDDLGHEYREYLSPFWFIKRPFLVLKNLIQTSFKIKKRN